MESAVFVVLCLHPDDPNRDVVYLTLGDGKVVINTAHSLRNYCPEHLSFIRFFRNYDLRCIFSNITYDVRTCTCTVAPRDPTDFDPLSGNIDEVIAIVKDMLRKAGTLNEPM